MLIDRPYGISKHNLILDHLKGPISECADVADIDFHVSLKYLHQLNTAVRIDVHRLFVLGKSLLELVATRVSMRTLTFCLKREKADILFYLIITKI